MNLKSVCGLVGGLTCALTCALPSQGAVAALKPEKVSVAEAKKTKVYVLDGVIVGGDWAIDSFKVSGIRRAANPGYERIVVDLEGSRAGEPVALERPPYYHVAVSHGAKRVVVTILGRNQLTLAPDKVAAAFKKSKLISSVDLMPMMEKDRWSFVMNLRAPGSVEVFELALPTRIILDVKAGK